MNLPRPLALLPVVLAFFTAPLCSQTPDAEGFVPLFNGRDLTGWTPCNVAADTFRWENGMVITTGVPTGFMRTEKMYENFIVELEWRHLKEAGNSGLFIWGEGLPAPGVPYARGIEVQILDPGYEKNKGANEWFTGQGDIFPIWGATMTATGRIATGGKRSFPTENRTKASPEWNHYRVHCQDGEIRLSVNGREVTVGRDCFPRKGFLCLESEGSETHFRNVRIKELPGGAATPAQTARAYAGFRPLFYGKTLAGWKISAEAAPLWSAHGAVFRGKADPAGKGGDLWTEQDHGDFVLCMDWRLTGKPEKKPLQVILPNGEEAVDAQGRKKTEEVMDAGDSGIFLRGTEGARINITCNTLGSGGLQGSRTGKELPEEMRAAWVPGEKADLKPGAWNRFFITVKGNRVTVELNEKVVIRDALLPGLPAKGAIGLQHRGDAVEFGNLFIREL